MINLLIWILAFTAIVAVTVFTGKRKGLAATALQDNEAKAIEASKSIMAVSLMLMLILYPLFYYNGHAYDALIRISRSTELKTKLEIFWETVRLTGVSRTDQEGSRYDNSVYAQIILTSVFNFFAGMYLYKKGFAVKHKKLFIIPAAVLLINVVLAAKDLHDRCAVRPDLDRLFFLETYAFALFESYAGYLLGSALSVVSLYILYLVLRKIFKTDTVPLFVILVLSFFPSCLYWGNGITDRSVYLKEFVFGANIPLFPIGMIVMRFGKKILPGSKKSSAVHLAVWTTLGTLSFASVFKLQTVLMKIWGYSLPSHSGCYIDPVTAGRISDYQFYFLKAGRMTAVPWLIFGLSISMIFLILALWIGTGNRVTAFLRKHAFPILVLHLSKNTLFAYKFKCADPLDDLLTGSISYKDIRILAPVLWLVLYVIIAYLITRFILDKIKPSVKASKVIKDVAPSVPVPEEEKTKNPGKTRRKIIRCAVVFAVLISILLGYGIVMRNSDVNGFWVSYNSSRKYVAYVHDKMIDVYLIGSDGNISSLAWAGSFDTAEGSPLSADYRSTFDSLRTSILLGAYRSFSNFSDSVSIDYKMGVLAIKNGALRGVSFIRSLKPYDECISRYEYYESIKDDASYEPRFSLGRQWVFQDYEDEYVHSLIALEVTNLNPYRIAVPLVLYSWPGRMQSRIMTSGSMEPGETAILICEGRWVDSVAPNPSDLRFVLKTSSEFCTSFCRDDHYEITDVEVTSDAAGMVRSVRIDYTADEEAVGDRDPINVIFYNGDDVVGVGYEIIDVPDAAEGANSIEIYQLTPVSVDDYDRIEVELL
ncbi:MAG: hypothetical protein J5685_03840 [Clostridiales bacterium]|nr:hypothetical protein [Clostridiales bacterium]